MDRYTVVIRIDRNLSNREVKEMEDAIALMLSEDFEVEVTVDVIERN